MLFHLGALWQLNELVLLVGMVRISCVSGGSITGGRLALQCSALAFHSGSSSRLVTRVVDPMRKLASRTVEPAAIPRGVLLPDSGTPVLPDASSEYLTS